MEQTFVAKLVLKLQEAFQQSDEMKSRLRKDFSDVQASAVIKPEVQTSAIDELTQKLSDVKRAGEDQLKINPEVSTAGIDTIKAKIAEMQAKIGSLKSTQLTLVDVKGIELAQSGIRGLEDEIQQLTGTLESMEATRDAALADRPTPSWTEVFRATMAAANAELQTLSSSAPGALATAEGAGDGLAQALTRASDSAGALGGIAAGAGDAAAGALQHAAGAAQENASAHSHAGAAAEEHGHKATKAQHGSAAAAHAEGKAVHDAGEHGAKAHSKLHDILHKVQHEMGHVGKTALGMLGGGMLMNGISGITGNLHDLFHAGQHTIQWLGKAELHFGRAGLAGAELKQQLKETKIFSKEMGDQLGIDQMRLKDLAVDAAYTASATGEFNKDLVRLSAGLEKASMGVLKGEDVIQALSKSTPQAQQNLKKLTSEFPELAGRLKGITDPAERTRIALDALSPTFKKLEENADGPEGAMVRMQNTFGKFQMTVGTALYTTIADLLIPVLNLFMGSLNGISSVLSYIPGPVGTVIKFIVLATAAYFGYNLALQSSIVLNAKKMIQDAWLQTAEKAALAVTWLKTTALSVQNGVKELLNITTLKYIATMIWNSIVTKAFVAAVWLEQAALYAVNTVRNLLHLSTLKQIAAQIWENGIKVVSTALTWAQVAATTALTTAMTVLTSPITLIVLGLAALVAGVIYAYKNFEGFRNGVNAVWQAVQTATMFFLKWLNPIGLLIQGFKYLYNNVEGFRKAVDTAVSAVTSAGSALLSMLGITKETTDATEQHATALEKAAAARAELTAAVQAGVAAYKAEKDAIAENTGYLSDQITVKLDWIRKTQEFLKRTDISDTVRKNTEAEIQKQLADIESLKRVGQVRKRTQEEMERDAKLAQEMLEGETDAAYLARMKKRSELFEQTNGQQGSSLNATIAQLKAHVGKLRQGTNEEKQVYQDYLDSIRDLQQKREGILTFLSLGSISELDKKLKEVKSRVDEDIKKIQLAAKEAGVSADPAITNRRAEAQREQEKIVEDIRVKANITEAAELDRNAGEIQRKYLDQNKALAELRAADYISQEDEDRAKLAHAVQQNEDLLKIGREFFAKKREEAVALAQVELDATTKGAGAMGGTAQFAVQQSALRAFAEVKAKSLDKEQADIEAFARKNIKDDKLLKAALLDIATKSEAAKRLLQIETNEAANKLDLERIEHAKQNEIALVELQVDRGDIERDGIDHKLKLLDVEYDAEKEALRKKYQDNAEYQQKLKELEAQHTADRNQAMADHVREHNLLFKGMAAGVTSVFEQASKHAIEAIGRIVGFHKEESEEMLEEERKLDELDLKDKIAKMQKEVRENKMSYERYLLEKAKAERDYEKKRKGDKEDELTFLQSVEKAITEGVVGELAKRGEAYVADQIIKLLTEETKQAAELTTGIVAQTSAGLQVAAHAEESIAATTSAGIVAGSEGTKQASFLSTAAAAITSAITEIYQWFASLPFGVGIALGAAVVGGMIALIASGKDEATSTVKGAAKGLVHDPMRDGREGQMIAIGETGKKEFASPEEDALTYFGDSLGPQIYKRALANVRGQMPGMYASGQIVPRVAPNLEPEFRRTEGDQLDIEAIQKFNMLLGDIADNGIGVDVTGKIDAKLDPRETERAVRQRTREVNRRAGVQGGGMR